MYMYICIYTYIYKVCDAPGDGARETAGEESRLGSSLGADGSCLSPAGEGDFPRISPAGEGGGAFHPADGVRASPGEEGGSSEDATVVRGGGSFLRTETEAIPPA